MIEQMHKNPQVLAFVSGKGGSGKTALSLSMAEVLAGAGLRTLIIDIDLATHGATYFFANLIGSSIGIVQYLASQSSRSVYAGAAVGSMVVNIHDNLWFTPSNSQLDFRQETAVVETPEETFNRLHDGLQTLIDYVTKELKVEIVIIDCQAGVSTAMEAALGVSDRSVLVLEHDTISTDAAKRLERRVANGLPTFHRWIINKLRVKEARTYPEMTRTLQALDHLPPIPFDWEVRQAYGEREIPVKLDEPSTMLFAVLRALKVILPETRSQIEQLERERIDGVYHRYQINLKIASEKRDSLRQAIADIDRQVKQRWWFAAISLAYLGIGVTAASVLSMLSALELLPVESGIVWAGVIAIGGFIATTYGIWSIFERRKTADADLAREELEREIHASQEDVERFESYMYSRSEEFLIDFGPKGEREMQS